MSLSRSGRRFARVALGAGLLMAPFVGGGVANAALAGAPPATTTLRPDLRTVHVLTGINAGRVQYCFDKPLNITGAAASFRLGGYRWDTILSGTGTPILDANVNCAIVNLGARDLASYTFGTVEAAVASAGVSGGQPNLADSTANLDSTSKNGTAGRTTGPDLQGVTIGSPAGTNEIIYSFDQPVDTATANLTAGNFRYYDSSGTIHRGMAITGTDSVGNVRVQFNVPTVSGAVIAYVFRGIPNAAAPDRAGQSNTPDPETYAPTLSVTVAGTSGTTALPDLASTTLVPGSTNQIDYTFNKIVALSGGSAAAAPQFVATASNGDDTTGSSATVLADGKTVRVTFNTPANITNYLEEITVASVDDDAVTSTNGFSNLAQGKPAGDNAGAFATGFTNGPDATSVAFDANAGQAIVKFDQRVAANAAGRPVDQTGGLGTTPLTSFQLRDANGNKIGTVTNATVESIGPFRSQVRVTFANPADLANAKSLELVGNQTSSGTTPYVNFAGSPAPAVFTSGQTHGAGQSGFNPAGNVEQIIAPTATAAAFSTKASTVRSSRLHLRRVHITRKHAARHTRRHNSRRSR